MFNKVIAIETSCDDTSIAVVRQDGFVESVISANQDNLHRAFGGVVPEIAGRSHSETILPLIDQCLKDADVSWSEIDGVVVTNRPGLVGSLIVGVVTAKALAMAKNLPLLGVNHLEAHLLAPFLKDSEYAPPEDFSYPYIALAISGGHTHLYYVEGLGRYHVLGATLDDAAGEAFDKFAKILGLGFPGGVQVDKLAKTGDIAAYKFPRSLIHEDNFNFSFSGLKASGQRLLESLSSDEKKQNVNDLCASFQEAIVDVLISKLDRACKKFGLKKAVLTGGVSANSRLRERALEWANKNDIQIVIPPIRYCTDNAAMVGYVGVQKLNNGQSSDQSMAPSPKVLEDDFIYGELEV